MGSADRGRVAGLLWPERSDHEARRNLRQMLHRFEELGELLLSVDPLELRPDTSVDALYVAELGRDNRWDEVVSSLRGEESEFLKGVELADNPELTEWVWVQRERFASLERRALSHEVERWREIGKWDAALSLARRLCNLEPVSEPVYRSLAELHLMCGDKGNAILGLRRLEQNLRTLLDIEPSEETRGLMSRIGSPRLVSGSVEIPQGGVLPLVGREEAWAELEEAWADMQTVIVLGPGGIGKSRLLRDFSATKGLVFRSFAHPGDRKLAYATFSRNLSRILNEIDLHRLEPWVLAELGRLIPGLQVVPPILDGELGETRLMEAIARTLILLAERVVALVNDDLHNWDPVSYRVGAMIAARSSSMALPLRSLNSANPEVMPPESLDYLTDLEKDGLLRIIRLHPLSLREVTVLLTASGLDSREAEEAFRLSGGLPGDLAEWITARRSSGPESVRMLGVQALVKRRFGQLSHNARAVLDVLALNGEDTELEVVSRVLELPLIQVLAGFNELEEKGVLVAPDFVHDQVGPLTVASLGRHKLRALRMRLAVVLSELPGSEEKAAWYWLASGETAKAYPLFSAAARRAMEGYAEQSALELYFRAMWTAPDPAAWAFAALGAEEVAERDLRTELLAQLEGAMDALPLATMHEVRLRGAKAAMQWGDMPGRGRCFGNFVRAWPARKGMGF